MRPHQHRQETEAVRGGADLSKEEWPALYSDLSDRHLRSHRQRPATSRHQHGHVLHPLREPYPNRGGSGHRGIGRHGCCAPVRFRNECHHNLHPRLC